jgi:hypothetical protein
MKSLLVSFLVAFVGLVAVMAASEMPLPFTRELLITKPMISGSDVIIAQEMLNRDIAVLPQVSVSGKFEQWILWKLYS